MDQSKYCQLSTTGRSLAHTKILWQFLFDMYYTYQDIYLSIKDIFLSKKNTCYLFYLKCIFHFSMSIDQWYIGYCIGISKRSLPKSVNATNGLLKKFTYSHLKGSCKLHRWLLCRPKPSSGRSRICILLNWWLHRNWCQSFWTWSL